MITATPTSYEINDDETKDVLAKISMFDEGASTVEIITAVDAESWLELSAAIYAALMVMHPKKEGANE